MSSVCLKVALGRYSGLIVLVLLIVVFSLLKPDTFFTMRTLRSLVADQAVTAIASIGLMVAFACGAFDLSVGGVLGLGIVMVTWLQAEHDFSAWMAVVAALVVGLVVGAVNGMIVTVLKVNSFTATLAMASITEAVIYGVSGGRQVRREHLRPDSCNSVNPNPAGSLLRSCTWPKWH